MRQKEGRGPVCLTVKLNTALVAAISGPWARNNGWKAREQGGDGLWRGGAERGGGRYTLGSWLLPTEAKATRSGASVWLQRPWHFASSL